MRKIVLLLNPSRTYTRGLLSGVAKYARLQGLWTFYRPLEYREPKARRGLLQVLKSLQPDGIFMREPAEMEQIIAMDIPTVSFSYSREIIPGVANVIADHRAVGEIAARHFLDRGFRRFAYCGFDDWWWSRSRRDGFCHRVAGAGYLTDVYQLPSKSRRSWAKELPVVASWLHTLEKPVGLLACNDDRGELVVEACKIAGLSVPDQVAIMGVDNDALICDLCSPPLSSVALSLERAGYESAALLDRMMTGKQRKTSPICITPTHIVTRQSTDILAVEDAEVAKAIRFIRQHAKTNVNVEAVVRQVSLSRRVLEKRFRQILGKSIHEEIRQARVELLVKMLSETQMSISDIAHALDFDDVTHLSRYFRKEKGLSPLQYRKQKT
jgi:LacI family transcriptional regulator